MVIYLVHPKHGSKVALAEAEAVADERNGWMRVVPDKIREPLGAVECVAAVVREVRRRGRTPRPEGVI